MASPEPFLTDTEEGEVGDEEEETDTTSFAACSCLALGKQPAGDTAGLNPIFGRPPLIRLETLSSFHLRWVFFVFYMSLGLTMFFRIAENRVYSCNPVCQDDGAACMMNVPNAWTHHDHVTRCLNESVSLPINGSYTTDIAVNITEMTVWHRWLYVYASLDEVEEVEELKTTHPLQFHITFAKTAGVKAFDVQKTISCQGGKKCSVVQVQRVDGVHQAEWLGVSVSGQDAYRVKLELLMGNKGMTILELSLRCMCIFVVVVLALHLLTMLRLQPFSLWLPEHLWLLSVMVGIVFTLDPFWYWGLWHNDFESGFEKFNYVQEVVLYDFGSDLVKAFEYVALCSLKDVGEESSWYWRGRLFKPAAWSAGWLLSITVNRVVQVLTNPFEYGFGVTTLFWHPDQGKLQFWLMLTYTVLEWMWYVVIVLQTYRTGRSLQQLPYLQTRYRQLTFRFIVFLYLCFVVAWLPPWLVRVLTPNRPPRLLHNFGEILGNALYACILASVLTPVTDYDRKSVLNDFPDPTNRSWVTDERLQNPDFARFLRGDQSLFFFFTEREREEFAGCHAKAYEKKKARESQGLHSSFVTNMLSAASSVKNGFLHAGANRSAEDELVSIDDASESGRSTDGNKRRPTEKRSWLADWVGWLTDSGLPPKPEPLFCLETARDLFNLSWEVYFQDPERGYDGLSLESLARREKKREKERKKRVKARQQARFTQLGSRSSSLALTEELYQQEQQQIPQQTSVRLEDSEVCSVANSQLKPSFNTKRKEFGRNLPELQLTEQGTPFSMLQRTTFVNPEHALRQQVADEDELLLLEALEDKTFIKVEQYGFQLEKVVAKSQNQALVAIRDEGREVAVAFRGTSNAANVKTDMTFSRQVIENWTLREEGFGKTVDNAAHVLRLFQPRVHSGFYKVWSEILKEDVLGEIKRLCSLYDVRRILLTGHSLGGALATLASWDVARWLKDEGRSNVHLTMYNFGCPRVGNAVFSAAHKQVVPDSFRIVNDGDVVCSTPPRLYIPFLGPLYKHVGRPVMADWKGNFVVCPTFVERAMPRWHLRSSDPTRHQMAGDAAGYAAGRSRSYRSALDAVFSYCRVDLKCLEPISSYYTISAASAASAAAAVALVAVACGICQTSPVFITFSCSPGLTHEPMSPRRRSSSVLPPAHPLRKPTSSLSFLSQLHSPSESPSSPLSPVSYPPRPRKLSSGSGLVVL